MSCLKCRRELVAEFLSCPYCGLERSSLPDGIKLAQMFGDVETGGKSFHLRAQERIFEIGRKLGFNVLMEYEVQNLVKVGRRSFIDVVWTLGSRLVAGFEVKPKRRDLEVITTHKDVAKLQNFTAPEKFIANVSELTGRAYFLRVSATTAPRPKSYSIVKVKEHYPRAYEAWSVTEDNKLLDEFGKGIPLLSLAAIHRRQPTAMRSRLVKLGAIPPAGSQETTGQR